MKVIKKTGIRSGRSVYIHCGAMKKERFLRIGLWILFNLIFSFYAAHSASADVSRPDEGKGPTRVHVVMFVIDVDQVDTANQSFDANVYIQSRWRDPRLAHSGPNEVSQSMEEVWNPRIQIVNQQKIWATFPHIVEITPDGEVTYRQRYWGTFSQPLPLQDFPFDRQVFTIQLAAAGYGTDEVELLTNKNIPSGISPNFSVADWEILNWKVESRPFKPMPGIKGIAGYAFSFEARRESGYFIVKVIIPLIFIVAMSWVVFWIDPKESGTQISVAITTMLTLIAYRFAVGVSVPRVSYLTRLDYFILGATFLVFASLVQVVITSTFAKTGKLARARTIDLWARLLFPLAFVLLAVESLVLRIGL